MDRRNLLYLSGLVAALILGQWLGRAAPSSVPVGVSPAWADAPIFVDEGETFVSTDEGNAYLWRRDGDRIVLINHCLRLAEGPTGQATYVSLPGVERGS
jgi:hypothetical protein